MGVASIRQQRVVVDLFAAHLLKHLQQVGHVHALAFFARHVEHHLAWCSITVRWPTSRAWRMLCVTIMVVSWFSATMRAVSCSTKSGGARVERGGVLVEQQDARGLQRRHEQAHGLALAAGANRYGPTGGFPAGRAWPERSRNMARSACLTAPRRPARATFWPGPCFPRWSEVLAGAGHGILERPRHALGAFLHRGGASDRRWRCGRCPRQIAARWR